MSSDHNILLSLSSDRKQAINNEKIAGEHDLSLGLGSWEGVIDQLTRTYGGLLGEGSGSMMREVSPMIYPEDMFVKKK